MKQVENISCDTVIAGGGIAGLVCALELLAQDQRVIIVDRDIPERLGGLARWAFGGMALSGTAEQKRMKIPDNAQVLLNDWYSFANFSNEDHWPKAWAKEYAEQNYHQIYLWLKALGIKFLPAVNWVERGLHAPGNTLPRYHVMWGTGWQLVETIIEKLTPYLHNQQLTIFHQHKVIRPIMNSAKCHAVLVKNEQSAAEFMINADNVVIACGGINGSSARVTANWCKAWDKVPENILNGANPISDGQLHDAVQHLGGKLTHIDNMWNYAAGIRHPQAEFDGHGLSLIPCKSALWVDHLGKRIGPQPLVTGFDTHFLCQQVARQEKSWTWQILNWRIAKKELAVSGSMHNPSIRDKKLVSFFKEVLFGNKRLIKQLVDESDDVICAENVAALVDKMNELTDQPYIDLAVLKEQIQQFDQHMAMPDKLQNDEQIRRINHARQWQPDRLRTCKPAPLIQQGKHLPLIAIKVQLISRKSLGGVQTNLDSQVINHQQEVINGLYCIGEAAGFGGGGANGEKSLEGTFLAGCILTARNAAKAILSTENLNK